MARKDAGARSAFYDRYDYRKFWQKRTYEDLADKNALQTFLKHQEGPKTKILDVGAGYGRNALVYASQYDSCTLLDPSQKNLDLAKVNLKNYSHISFVKGTAEKIPFAAKSFDTVVCVRVFHHLFDPEPAITEFSRILKPGGELYLEVANKQHALALLKSLFNGTFNEILSPLPLERRSQANIKDKSITFVNHNTLVIDHLLKDHGFQIKEVLSVSNFRSPLTRNKFLLPIFSLLEKLLQKPLSIVQFGPSIYFRAQRLVE